METTRIYTVEVTEIIKGEASDKNVAADEMTKKIKAASGADDVVCTLVQDFVLD